MSSLSDANEQGVGQGILNASDLTSGAAAQSDGVPSVKAVKKDSTVALGSAEKLTDGSMEGMEWNEVVQTDTEREAQLHSPGSVSPVYIVGSWERIHRSSHGEEELQVQLQDEAGNLLFDGQN